MRYRVLYNPALNQYKVQLKPDSFWFAWAFTWVDFGDHHYGPKLFETEVEAEAFGKKLCADVPLPKDEWRPVEKYTDYMPR